MAKWDKRASDAWWGVSLSAPRPRWEPGVAEALVERLGYPFGVQPADLCDPDERLADAVMVCEAAEEVARNGRFLDARALVDSVGPDPSAFVRRIHDRHRVTYNRPSDRHQTMSSFSHFAGEAVGDCQLALGISRLPPSRPGFGSYFIHNEPCVVEALLGGRTLEEIADLVSMNELRKGAKLVSWLRKEPGACDPVDDRDFWIGWPGNEARLLKACRDLVSRRIGWFGGLREGEPIFAYAEDAFEKE